MALCVSNSPGIFSTLAPWVTISITVILWFLSREKDRKQERFKKLLEYRVSMLTGANDFFDFMIELSKNNNFNHPDFANRSFALRRSIEQFGNDQENDLFQKFGQSFFVEKNIEAANIHLLQLRQLITNNVRKELGLGERVLKQE